MIRYVKYDQATQHLENMSSVVTDLLVGLEVVRAITDDPEVLSRLELLISDAAYGQQMVDDSYDDIETYKVKTNA